MNNNLSEEQYNALVRDAMSWRKHCILADKAEAAIMDHRGHSYWEGYSDGKREASSMAERQLMDAVALLRRCSSGAYDNAVGRRDAGRWLLENFPLKQAHNE